LSQFVIIRRIMSQPQPLWMPSQPENTAMYQFRQRMAERFGETLPDYAALHAWSVADIGRFWKAYIEDANLPIDTRGDALVGEMPNVTWFPEATLNYAQVLLEPPHTPDHATAIIALDEHGRERRYTYADMRQQVAQAQKALEKAGVTQGDRVAAYVANVPEAVIAMLACASLGAIYSSCSPDFGGSAALARFGQIEPKVLLASDGYWYNGKHFSTRSAVEDLRDNIASVQVLVSIPHDDTPTDTPTGARVWDDWLEPATTPTTYTPLPFDHPLYILYSSGTTGLPKAIVHRAGGALLKQHSEHKLHSDVRPGDVVFYFTTCGWMMWNWLVSGLAQGASIVLFDGSPSYPSLDILWQHAARLGFTFFGTSARFIHSCQAQSMVPKDLADLSTLRTIASTGSPLSPAGFAWVYEAVKADLHLASISGGTDIVGCFMLGNPELPVYSGQIQSPALGVDLVSYSDDAEPRLGEPGELVCRQPLPSMPLMFWNDPNGTRYVDAYFGHFAGVWRHGDLIEITPQQGIVVYGRSDATLNPGGVRIGTAEIYRPLEDIDAVLEAAAVGKRDDGDEVIWLFVVLREGVSLDEELTRTIKQTLRSQASPRHVPKRVIAVPALPHTRSGKMMEIAIARLVNGQSVPNKQVMVNPESLEAIADAITNV
jgi:acetoacetyl-CoA synthetase